MKEHIFVYSSCYLTMTKERSNYYYMSLFSDHDLVTATMIIGGASQIDADQDHRSEHPPILTSVWRLTRPSLGRLHCKNVDIYTLGWRWHFFSSSYFTSQTAIFEPFGLTLCHIWAILLAKLLCSRHFLFGIVVIQNIPDEWLHANCRSFALLCSYHTLCLEH